MCDACRLLDAKEVLVLNEDNTRCIVFLFRKVFFCAALDLCWHCPSTTQATARTRSILVAVWLFKHGFSFVGFEWQTKLRVVSLSLSLSHRYRFNIRDHVRREAYDESGPLYALMHTRKCWWFNKSNAFSWTGWFIYKLQTATILICICDSIVRLFFFCSTCRRFSTPATLLYKLFPNPNPNPSYATASRYRWPTPCTHQTVALTSTAYSLGFTDTRCEKQPVAPFHNKTTEALFKWRSNSQLLATIHNHLRVCKSKATTRCKQQRKTWLSLSQTSRFSFWGVTSQTHFGH